MSCALWKAVRERFARAPAPRERQARKSKHRQAGEREDNAVLESSRVAPAASNPWAGRQSARGKSYSQQFRFHFENSIRRYLKFRFHGTVAAILCSDSWQRLRAAGLD